MYQSQLQIKITNVLKRNKQKRKAGRGGRRMVSVAKQTAQHLKMPPTEKHQPLQRMQKS
jgi:hypothetical protein